VPDTANALEAIRLINDWGKWLIAIETAAIAVIGALFTAGRPVSRAVRLLGSSAISCFLVSIIAAAMLLATLPEIAQTIAPTENVWNTSDSVAGRLFHMSTQDFALVESIFFGAGIALFVTTIVTAVWTRTGEQDKPPTSDGLPMRALPDRSK
jgi:hypothetical protein